MKVHKERFGTINLSATKVAFLRTDQQTTLLFVKQHNMGPGLTQTGLCSYRRWLEILDFEIKGIVLFV